MVSLSSGILNPSLNRDILVVASPSSLMAYDVHNNSDVFTSEVRDGVYSMILGQVDVNNAPLRVALVGGNCSVLGFDMTGSDVFWTVSGDNVSAIDFFMTEKNERRILVGSEDYAIRIFNNEEMLFEINETAKITGFCEMSTGKYAYSLDSGGVGVYKGTHRMWKAKAKHKVTSQVCCDITGEGIPVLALGWSNGKVELRSERKGEDIFKKMLKQPIAKIMYEDYRLEGKKQIVAVTNSGKIVGLGKETQVQTEPQPDQLEDLNKQKTSLLNELQSLKDQSRGASIPNYTSLSVSFQTSPLTLLLSSNNNTCIKCSLLLSEGLFENDLKLIHPSRPSSDLKIPLNNPKNLECEIDIKALIGSSSSSQQFQLFERRIKLPKYCNFSLEPCTEPSSQVSFSFSFTPKLQDWIKAKFLVNEQDLMKINDGKFRFVSEKENLHIYQVDRSLRVMTESIDLAGEVIQDLAGFFGVTELNSSASFTRELAKIKELLEKIEDFNTVRTQLTVNMAENCQNVKTLLVKAEDARIQRNMQYFKQNLSNLHQFNGQLLGEYQIRANNHSELLNCLKVINQFIQRAGNLRCGQAKNKCIALFREGIKNRNFGVITQAVCNGN
jgi:Bardet-Biedl syndrome 2 protein